MRQLISQLDESLIRVVANAALDRSDVLKFWFGESDEVTPMAIRDAASASLQAGETFIHTIWVCRPCARPWPATAASCEARVRRRSHPIALQ